MTAIPGIAGVAGTERFRIVHDQYRGEFYIEDRYSNHIPLHIPTHIMRSMNRPQSQKDMEYLYNYILRSSAQVLPASDSSGLTMTVSSTDLKMHPRQRDVTREEQYFRNQAAARKAAVRRLKSCSEAFIRSMEHTIDSECEVALRTIRAYSD